MNTCSACAGYGWVYGDYPACYSCSGSGRGGFTNVSCAACGGSGRGTIRTQVVCFACGGSGKIPGSQTLASSTESRPVGSSARANRSPPARKPARPWTRAEAFALVPVTGISAAGLNGLLDFTGWWLFGASLLSGIIIVRAWKILFTLMIAGVAVWALAGRDLFG